MGETGVTGTCRSTQSSRPMTFAGSIPTRSTRRSRAASATRSRTSPARRSVVVGHDMRAVVGAARRRVHRGGDARRRRRHRHRARARPTSSTSPSGRSTRPARCSPPATTRRSTTASSCAGPARRRSASRPGSSRSRRWSPPGVTSAGRGGRARSSTVDLLDEFAEHVRSFVDRDGAAAAHGRRRHRERHGRARRAQGVRGPAVRPHGPVRRARRHVPEPPGRPDPGREPEGPAAGGASTAAPTSASRSTATPTACSSSTTWASR